MKKRALTCIIFYILLLHLTPAKAQAQAQEQNQTQPFIGIANIKYFERAYPDITFSRKYDQQLGDWIISVKVPDSPGDKDGPGKTTDFVWANGSLLPKEEVANSEQYWTLLYGYQKELIDPATYTQEERERIKLFSSKESRKNGAGTPMFFFDALYDATSRARLESHIKKITFLGNRTNVHERMIVPLAQVEKKIYKLAESKNPETGAPTKEAQEVKDFLANLKSNDAYFWRIINGTNRKSFHSLGIAIDVLPKKQGGKQIFWDWARDKYPNTWMLIPLKDRWMPPLSVIQIFEEEGFIWGGKWVIYDNMHFEYHPELIQYNFYR